MVVQHNLIAMNANRMLGVTSKSQSKSSEKLSSGYRINRAADDAAGLSISEKMRKQINGLDRSSTNAQDGVSSVQTAEGALSEVHSMLQRMNELSVQAANASNSLDDREAIQSEIEQLSTEIDRVAETTKFNETYLLKGNDEVKVRHYPKAHDAGLKGILTDEATTGTFEIPTFWPEDEMVIGAVKYTIGSSKEDAAEVIKKAAADVESYAASALEAHDTAFNPTTGYEKLSSDNYTAASQITGTTQSANENRAYYNYLGSEYNKLKDQYANLEGEYKNLIEVKQIKIGRSTYTAEYDPNNSPAITWRVNPMPADGNDVIQSFPNDILPVPSGVVVEHITSPATSSTDNVVQAVADAERLGNTAKTMKSTSETYTTTTGKYATISSELKGVYEKLEGSYKDLLENPYQLAMTNDEDGKREVLIGEKTYIASYDPNAANGVVWTEYFSGEQVEDLVAAETPVKERDRVMYQNMKMRIMTDTEDGGKGNGVDDNIPTLITADKAYEYIQRELTAANNIGTTAQKATVTTEAIDTKSRERVAIFSIEKGFAEVNAALDFALHVGSDADMTNKISVNIETMNTANLGLEGMNIADDTGLAATYAVDAITDALAIVSEQRSALGAIQNRLEHTISNLDNVVENTTSAESRIRDTDMADEMVEFSKGNILMQAGQAMLAQANQSTQGVLSLLQ